VSAIAIGRGCDLLEKNSGALAGRSTDTRGQS
jgi:hypothetical protein